MEKNKDISPNVRVGVVAILLWLFWMVMGIRNDNSWWIAGGAIFVVLSVVGLYFEFYWKEIDDDEN